MLVQCVEQLIVILRQVLYRLIGINAYRKSEQTHRRLAELRCRGRTRLARLDVARGDHYRPKPALGITQRYVI